MGCLVGLLVVARRDSPVAARLGAAVVAWVVAVVAWVLTQVVGAVVGSVVTLRPRGVRSPCRTLHLLEAARRSIRRILPCWILFEGYETVISSYMDYTFRWWTQRFPRGGF